MKPEDLALLRCPESRQSLSLANPDLVAQINGRIAAGQVVNRAGETVAEAVEGALVREDGRFFYPIRNGLPVMLADQAAPLVGDDTMFLVRNI